MTGSYWILGINDQLDKNARDILIQQTENRRSYLQNEMIQKWSNLSTISQTINERTQQLKNCVDHSFLQKGHSFLDYHF